MGHHQKTYALKPMPEKAFKYTPENLKTLPRDHIFVFGSNLLGRHGRGAALTAKKYFQAKMGVGYGRTGQSYAIPTKGRAMATLGLEDIGYHIRSFLWFASVNDHMIYVVTKIGCGLAGYDEEDIKNRFIYAPPNVILPKGWG